MEEWFTQVLSNTLNAINYGNTGAILILIGLAAITDIGVPVPFVLDTILFTAAYQVGPISQQVGIMLFTLFVGRQLGTAALYFLSRGLGEALVRQLERRWPRIRIRLEKVESELSHMAPVGIMAARLTPGILQLTSVAAGIIKLRYIYVVLGVTMSSLVYDGVLIGLGYFTSQGLNLLGIKFSAWTVLVFFAALSVLWVIIYVMIRRKRARTASLDDG